MCVVVAVVQVGVVGMFVHEVPWRCRWVWGSPGGSSEAWGVLVVLVVDVGVLVLHRQVLVFVLVTLDEVQVEADAHGRGGCDQPPGHRFLCTTWTAALS